MSNIEIAKTIMQQMGGNKFAVMTGAKLFVAVENGLQYKLPARFARDGINAIRVTLNGDDLYDVVYMRALGKSCKQISESRGLYWDDLQRDFTRVTGLDTHF